MVSASTMIEKISRWYDHTLGRWTLRHADEVVAVSEACEHFVRRTFAVTNIRTIYRGITSVDPHQHPSESEIHIGYVGRLVDLK